MELHKNRVPDCCSYFTALIQRGYILGKFYNCTKSKKGFQNFEMSSNNGGMYIRYEQ